MTFEDANVLVTGADGGIGLAIATAFADAGAHVIRHSNSFIDGHVTADFGSAEGITRLVEHVTAQFDSLDVLVNNAGYQRNGSLDALSVRDIEHVMRVNSVAPVILMASLSPLLRQSRLRAVINISSIHDQVPVADNVPYAMSKAALVMATRCAALAYAQDGIRVNAVSPGAVRTPMNEALLDEMGTAVWDERIPLGVVGSPDDISGAVLFLASPAARYITGASLVVDGGYSANLVRYPEVRHD
jgi:NAD(P)-dependent dehydrogenase (short-subunit alcohol dehydrogenase family)